MRKTRAQAAEGGSARKRTTRNPIDLHIGERLRQARVLRGLSQTMLGDRLGVTHQQIQKYEHGANRISAGRLWLIARELEVPLQWFFSNIAGPPARQPARAA